MKYAEIAKKEKVKDIDSFNKSKCPLCNDDKYIQWRDEKGRLHCKRCECTELDAIRDLWKKSDMNLNLTRKTWNNFIADNEARKAMKNIATGYYLNFEKIRNTEHNSMMLLGCPGSGKTHLTIATAYKLLKDKKIEVVYMGYVEAIDKMKRLRQASEIEQYEKLLNKYKNAKVLVIDDLFKNDVRDTDTRIMFEIINYRVNKSLPFMISSERLSRDLIKYDEGAAGRMLRAAKGYRIEIEGEENDYRLKGIR